MSEIGETLSYAFDRRGAWVALAWFVVPVIAFGVILVINLRHERLGPLRLSRRMRLATFSALLLAYLATLYGWLFWRTFYDLSLVAAKRHLKLTLLLPKRTLVLSSADIESVRQEPGPKGLGGRLFIATRGGPTYRSPVLARHESAAILGELRRFLNPPREPSRSR